MTGARFGKTQRLLEAADFKAVFDEAQYRASNQSVLMLARGNKLEHARLGIVASKKNCRLASGRNRLKRLIRESFRKQQATLAGLDIVVLPRRSLAEYDNRLVTEQLARQWKRLHKLAQPATQ